MKNLITIAAILICQLFFTNVIASHTFGHGDGTLTYADKYTADRMMRLKQISEMAGMGIDEDGGINPTMGHDVYMGFIDSDFML
jgi:hypothetical protein